MRNNQKTSTNAKVSNIDKQFLVMEAANILNSDELLLLLLTENAKYLHINECLKYTHNSGIKEAEVFMKPSKILLDLIKKILGLTHSEDIWELVFTEICSSEKHGLDFEATAKAAFASISQIIKQESVPVKNVNGFLEVNTECLHVINYSPYYEDVICLIEAIVYQNKFYEGLIEACIIPDKRLYLNLYYAIAVSINPLLIDNKGIVNPAFCQLLDVSTKTESWIDHYENEYSLFREEEIVYHIATKIYLDLYKFSFENNFKKVA
jgi:hypothetical protein